MIKRYYKEDPSFEEAMTYIQKFEPSFKGGDEALISKIRRKLAMKFHPDRGGDLEKLKLINQALDIIEKGGIKDDDDFSDIYSWKRQDNRGSNK